MKVASAGPRGGPSSHPKLDARLVKGGSLETLTIAGENISGGRREGFHVPTPSCPGERKGGKIGWTTEGGGSVEWPKRWGRTQRDNSPGTRCR